MPYFLIISLIIASFCAKNVFAKSPEEVLDGFDNITKTINHYPHSLFSFDDETIKWVPFNNLRRKSGSAFYAIGEPLFIEGYIRDIDNIPLDGVTVRMLQANANGAYNYML